MSNASVSDISRAVVKKWLDDRDMVVIRSCLTSAPLAWSARDSQQTRRFNQRSTVPPTETSPYPRQLD
jgi:hypothetical protein